MIAASLYISLCSARNRLIVRLRRLREPRYLLGAIVGGAYLYFTFFARRQGRRRATRPGSPPADAFAQIAGVGSLAASILIFAVAVLAWAVPSGSMLLSFSEAEEAFLLPAPVSRRQLIAHRLVRSQLGALFASVVTALVFPSAGSGRLRVVISMWVLLVTARVYFAGVALTRIALTSRPRWVSRWIPVAVVVSAFAIVANTVAQQWPRAVPTLDALVEPLKRLTTSGASGVVLWPFVALVRPLFAPAGLPFVLAWLAGVAVLAVTTAWTLWSADALDLALERNASRRVSAEAAPPRARTSRRWTAWQLQPHGRVEGLFAWKGAVQIVRAATPGSLLVLLPLLTAAIAIGSTTALNGGFRGLAGLVASMAMAATGATVLFGPQVARFDLRSDLKNIDVLKTWPVSAAAVIRGEMLPPIVLVSAISWAAIFTAWLFSGAVNLDAAWRASIALAAAIGTPALVGAQFAVQNTIALLFPAWVPVGNERPRGIDAMGQRLILLVGVVVSMAVLALPGVIVGGVLWFALRNVIGAAALVVAAVVFTAIGAVEVALISEMLGPAYDRIDVLSIERGE